MEFSLNICQHKVGDVSPRRRVGDSRHAPVYGWQPDSKLHGNTNCRR
ncbi:MAG: hypothetical protein LBT05_13620 [Planctomycetaceae bacterium]|nr:hypothetical protein [Planctomycetaceae bacterium]